MQFLQGKSTIDFMSKRKIALVLSLLLIIASIGSLFAKGLNFGIDFTGGYLIEVGYDTEVDIGPIRSILAENGFDDAQVQHFLHVGRAQYRHRRADEHVFGLVGQGG